MKGLQRFLGILNFNRRFIKGAARILVLEMNLVFSIAKTVLSSIPTLVHPDPSTRISLSVDATGSHVRVVLQQDVAGFWLL